MACTAEDFGGSPCAAILAEILMAAGDGRLSHALRRQFAKTTAALAVLEGIEDDAIRERLQQLWVDDVNRYVDACACPLAVRVRFAACLRHAVARRRRLARGHDASLGRR